MLAPHADDDVLGCGGTLCKHVQAGDPVQVIIVFNGLAGDPEGRYDGAAYRALRQTEARAGGAHLGLEDYEFWDYPEGHQPGPLEWRAAVSHLTEVVRSFQPDIVYAPWIGEYHLDHHVLARAARLALRAADFRGQAWGYEVWTPLIATRIVDVSDVYDRKVQAMREHASQLEYNDLVHKGLAITAQRAVYLALDARHGEAFCPLGDATADDLALLGG